MSEELQSAPESQDWSSYLSEQLTEVADDQLETESETEVVSEDIEVTDDSEEVVSDEETEEVEEAPLFNDDTEVELGEGRNPVKLAELKNGYLRQSDYTKKTQLLADERKTFESEKAEYEPVKGWLDYINTNPYLFQQVNQAIQEWNQTGVLPLEEVINTESGPYINHLMSENSRLQKELDRISGEYQTTKFDGDMKALVTDLKAEYGDLIDSEYEQSLIDQAKEQGLSTDVLKRIAKGDLAEKKLQQAQEDGKKAEAKTKQKIRETKLPPQPKKVGNQPAKEDLDLSGDWLSIFKQVGK